MNRSLPKPIERILRGYQAVPVTIGKSRSTVTQMVSGTSKLFLKQSSMQHETREEMERLLWLAPRVKVPAVIAYEESEGNEFLLTVALDGDDATKLVAEDPKALVRGLAECLRNLHSISVEQCPFDQRLDVQISRARGRAQAGLVDETDFDRERQGRTALELLETLEKERPNSEVPVLTHGDACLPNFIFSGSVFNGFVDCGRAGLADRYQDLALVTRSLEANLAKEWVPHFFRYYELEDIDETKLAYYRLLDEFF